MKTSIVFFLLLTVFTSAYSQNRKINADKSSVTFKIKNAGLNVDGSFKGLSGQIIFDPKNLQASSFDVSIETKTISTGINARDNHLRKDEYFDAEKFPKIRFRSVKIEATKTGFVVTGNLTIKGMTQEIKIPFTFSEDGTFRGSFQINRLDFGVGDSSWIMGENVTVSLKVIAS